jgi:hypothetical protein
LPKGVFPSTLRIPATTPSLSHVTAMWAPPISFIPFLTSAYLSHVAASPHHLRPPCAARPPTSRCQSKSLLPHLDSHFLAPPLTPHLATSPSMALRPLPPDVSPFLTPVCPSSTPIKGEHHPRASPDLSPPLFSSLCAQALPAPSASSAGYSPPMPGHFRHSIVPSCSRRGSPPFLPPSSSTAVRFHARGRRFSRPPVSRRRGPVRSPLSTGAARGPPSHGPGP